LTTISGGEQNAAGVVWLLGASMWRFGQAASWLLITVVFALFGCSVAPLESQLERGPTVKDVVNHINCELASIVNKDPGNTDLSRKMNADPTLPSLLYRLTDDHFVASVLMTLDALDTEGVNPSLNFIHPLYPGTSLSTMYNVTLAVGGSLSGTQERNISLAYSVDLEQLQDKVGKDGRLVSYAVAHQCTGAIDELAEGGPGSSDVHTGLGGDLGLTEIVVSGLRGLDASNEVNIYGSSGPTMLTVSNDITGLQLQLIEPALPGTPAQPAQPAQPGQPAQPAQPAEPPKEDTELGILTFAGNMSFTPSTTDPTSPGTVTFTGTAAVIDDSNSSYPKSGNRYFIVLTGSTLQNAPNKNIAFSLAGTMSLLNKGTKADQWFKDLGYGPKLNLAGSIDAGYQTKNLSLSGTVTPDPAAENSAKFKEIIIKAPVGPKPTEKQSHINMVSAASSPSGGGGTQSKNTSASAGGSTQFSSLVSWPQWRTQLDTQAFQRSEWRWRWRWRWRR
jgi:hypothetical protein